VIQFLGVEGYLPAEVRRWMCDICGAACVWKRGVTDWLWMFQTGRRQTMDLPRLGQDHIVTNMENIAWVRNAKCKDSNQTNHSLSMELNFTICTVHAIVRNLVYYGACSQWDQSLVTGYTRNNACQYCQNVCRCTILRMMHLCSRCWQVMRPGVTILNPHEDQQIYSSLHLSQRNSSYKHLLVKWSWLCSLALRDTCFLTVMTHCKLLLSKSSKADYEDRTNIRVNSLTASPSCTTALFPMWPAEFRTNWVSWDWRQSDILHTVWTYHHAIFTSLEC
jgi:hypothetical protein